MECRDELLADFQEVYHLNLWSYDLEGADADEVPRIAALASQLSPMSRTMKKLHPDNHTLEVQLLRQIELNQRSYAWSQTKDAQNGNTATQPQPMMLPGEEQAHEEAVKREEKVAASVAASLGLDL